MEEENNFSSNIINFFLIIMITILSFIIIYLTFGYYTSVKIIKLVSLILIGFFCLVFIRNKIYDIKYKEEEKMKLEEQEANLARLERVRQKLEDDFEIYQGPVEQKIQKVDKNFLKEDFNQFSEMIFMKLMQAFNKRDYKEIKLFESKELFEKHRIEIQHNIDNKIINIKDQISIIYSKIYNFRQKGDLDILTVILKCAMQEYTVDENTKDIINGNNKEKIQYYQMEFIRKKGVKTLKSVNHLKAINCPSCGGPAQIIFAGECPYCGSIIMEGKHSWILNDLKLIKEL